MIIFKREKETEKGGEEEGERLREINEDKICAK